MLIGDTLRCISMMCTEGPISGPRVKIPAELVRPWDLLFYHFYRRPVLASRYCHRLHLCICPCVCVSIACLHDNSSPVQARINKFGSKAQNTLVKIHIVWGAIDLDLQDQIWPKSSNFPHFELVRTITHHLMKLQSPNLDQRCKTPWLRPLLFWGLLDIDLHVNSEYWNPIFPPNLFALFFLIFSETIPCEY